MRSRFNPSRRTAVVATAALLLLGGSAVAKSSFETGTYSGKTEKGKAFSAQVEKHKISSLKLTISGTCTPAGQAPRSIDEPNEFRSTLPDLAPILKIKRKGKFGGTLQSSGNGPPPDRTPLFSKQTLSGRVKGDKISGSYVESYRRRASQVGTVTCDFPKVKFSGKHK